VKVLVLDCGSSSLKFQLIETDAALAQAAGSATRAFVIPTNVELLIARDTQRIVSGQPPS